MGYRQPHLLPIYIWIYCLVWWLVQDAAKVGTFHLIRKYNLFDFQNKGMVVLPESTQQYIRDNKKKDLSSSDDNDDDNDDDDEDGGDGDDDDDDGRKEEKVDEVKKGKTAEGKEEVEMVAGMKE